MISLFKKKILLNDFVYEKVYLFLNEKQMFLCISNFVFVFSKIINLSFLKDKLPLCFVFSKCLLKKIENFGKISDICWLFSSKFFSFLKNDFLEKLANCCFQNYASIFIFLKTSLYPFINFFKNYFFYFLVSTNYIFFLTKNLYEFRFFYKKFCVKENKYFWFFSFKNKDLFFQNEYILLFFQNKSEFLWKNDYSVFLGRIGWFVCTVLNPNELFFIFFYCKDLVEKLENFILKTICDLIFFRKNTMYTVDHYLNLSKKYELRFDNFTISSIKKPKGLSDYAYLMSIPGVSFSLSMEKLDGKWKEVLRIEQKI